MSKRVSKAASLELTFLAALESIHADVDTSKIAEIHDWSGAVKGKFYSASVKKPSRLSRLKAALLSALKRPRAAAAPSSSFKGTSGAIAAASSNVASHGSMQYSHMAISQLIAVGISESSEEAWSEFVRRSQPLIKTVITRAVRRFGTVSHQLVDDLTQEVYLKIVADKFRALRTVEMFREDSFRGFLKIMATHTVHDYFRSAAALKRSAGFEREAPTNSAIPGTFAAPEREILLEEIDKVLNTISHERNFARDRAIFWLYYTEGFSAKEIAALPDIKLTAKGVESTLLRLTQHIRSNVATSDVAQRKKSLN